MKNLITLILVAFITVSCASFGEHPHDIKKAKDIGTLIDLKRYGPLTFAGQPDIKSLKSLKDQNYELVINLRGKNEFKKFDEEKIVKESGLDYFHVPFFTKDKRISRKAIQDIHKKVRDNHNKKIFIHCSSGNRAAAWLGAHLNLDHGVDIERSITVAKGVGMTKEKMEKKLREFLQ